MLPVGDSCIGLFQKKVGELYSFLRLNSKPTVPTFGMTPWMAWIGSPSLTAWDWHPFSGTRSSACLTMWQAISVLASKGTAHYFLGSFFAGLAGWVSSSCAQIYGGGGKSQGTENKALASGGGAAGLVHQPFCLYTLKGMSIFPKNWGDTWFLWTSLTRAWKWAWKWTVWTPGGMWGKLLWAVTLPQISIC